MKENELLTNVKRREENMNRVEVLDKVGTLLSLPNTELYTTEMVANYYEVGIEAIKSLIHDNQDEIQKNGYKVLNGDELSSLKELCQIKSRARSLATFSKRTVLNVGMLLTDSEIAKEVRKELLKENPELYYELQKCSQIRFKKYETEIKNYLIFSFGEENVQCQVRLGRYNLDFVLFDKIHVEVDENGHCGYDKDKELSRSEYIKNNSNYITIRYNPNKQKPYELIKNILQYID